MQRSQLEGRGGEFECVLFLMENCKQQGLPGTGAGMS